MFFVIASLQVFHFFRFAVCDSLICIKNLSVRVDRNTLHFVFFCASCSHTGVIRFDVYTVLSSVCLHVARYSCVFNISLHEEEKKQMKRSKEPEITFEWSERKKSQSSQNVLTVYDLFAFLELLFSYHNLCVASG